MEPLLSLGVLTPVVANRKTTSTIFQDFKQSSSSWSATRIISEQRWRRE